MAKEYIPTIGIECHVQLNTKTKLFAGVDNDARESEPNSKTSPLCLGLPGTLPVLNEKAVDLAIKAGIALNAEIAKFSKFDRKHYFYPDLPLGYQITQFDQPTVGAGKVEIEVDGEIQTIRINRAHLEADAGKTTHPAGSDYSLVDLNRAGTPLLEIVAEPDLHSAKAARIFAEELYHLMKYADVSDVDLYHGNMRFDVNVSLAEKGSKELGTRSETKNLNSFRAVEKAIVYEIERQTEILEAGNSVVQETRGWDDDKQITFSQRSKEEAHDYRYFPDPDLPPVIIELEYIESIRQSMPELPSAIRKKLADNGLSDKQIRVIISNRKYAEILLTGIEENVSSEDIKKIANWLTVDIQNILAQDQQLSLSFQQLEQLAKMVAANELSSSNAKLVIEEMIANGGVPKEIAKSKNLIQISDSSEIEKIVDKVLEENPQAIKDIVNGEKRAIGFIVGQIMKQSNGQANPKLAQEMINKKIKEKQ